MPAGESGMIRPEQPVTALPGVGESRAKLLEKLGVGTVEDLLYFFPRFVEDRSAHTAIVNLADGETAGILARVATNVQTMRVRKNLTIYTVQVRDGSGSANMVWYNNKFIKDQFHVGEFYKFYGKVQIKYGKREMVSPTYERADSNLHTGRVVPVYPLTENLHQKTLRGIMKQCVDQAVGGLKEYLPAAMREKYDLCEINYALTSIHFPAAMQDYQAAHRRLVFEELLMMQLGLLYARTAKKEDGGILLETHPYREEFLRQLPFQLTGAQQRVIGEILADLSSGKPMNRLVQGDVGSGKTIVAFAAMYIGVCNGMQTALMAPTEVLAVQHYKTAQKYFPPEQVALLTGSVTGKKRAAVLEEICSGRAKVVIGTHAVIEGQVEFQSLCLAITDEQHRFGVLQRAKLAQKGGAPHVLIMSATPIPRTLALILYGDLDISVVDEMPPGRTPVETFVVGPQLRPRIRNFIRKNVGEGRQVYIVCPLVEESEKTDIKAAAALAEELTQVLEGCRVALLHGRMRPKEKNEIMERFADAEIDVLVSTTVIEVGVNVPNATVMIIENAERFGLSQLHQIRGRVGRGSKKSYCVLFTESGGKQTLERLLALAETNDGFEIARKDLELRGPGDFLGTRQHGLPELKIANLLSDTKLMKYAQEAALEILRKDPQLAKHLPLKQKLNRMFRNAAEGNLIG